MMLRRGSRPLDSERGWSVIEVLAAAVILGMGILLFLKTKGTSQRFSSGNTRLLKAGHLVGKQIEDLRIQIAQNPFSNFPSNSSATVVVSPVLPDSIKMTQAVSDALSPKDGALVVGVKRLDFVASWGNNPLDTLKVTTYVSKNF